MAATNPITPPNHKSNILTPLTISVAPTFAPLSPTCLSLSRQTSAPAGNKSITPQFNYARSTPSTPTASQNKPALASASSTPMPSRNISATYSIAYTLDAYNICKQQVLQIEKVLITYKNSLKDNTAIAACCNELLSLGEQTPALMLMAVAEDRTNLTLRIGLASCFIATPIKENNYKSSAPNMAYWFLSIAANDWLKLEHSINQYVTMESNTVTYSHRLKRSPLKQHRLKAYGNIELPDCISPKSQ